MENGSNKHELILFAIQFFQIHDLTFGDGTIFQKNEMSESSSIFSIGECITLVMNQLCLRDLTDLCLSSSHLYQIFLSDSKHKIIVFLHKADPNNFFDQKFQHFAIIWNGFTNMVKLIEFIYFFKFWKRLKEHFLRIIKVMDIYHPFLTTSVNFPWFWEEISLRSISRFVSHIHLSLSYRHTIESFESRGVYQLSNKINNSYYYLLLQRGNKQIIYSFQEPSIIDHLNDPIFKEPFFAYYIADHRYAQYLLDWPGLKDPTILYTFFAFSKPLGSNWAFQFVTLCIKHNVKYQDLSPFKKYKHYSTFHSKLLYTGCIGLTEKQKRIIFDYIAPVWKKLYNDGFSFMIESIGLFQLCKYLPRFVIIQRCCDFVKSMVGRKWINVHPRHMLNYLSVEETVDSPTKSKMLDGKLYCITWP